MIKTKEELADFLESDRIALGKNGAPKVIGDYIYKFERALRYCEYYSSSWSLKRLISLYRYKKLSIKLGFTIPLNVFDEGLSIAHYGTIVVHPNARIGKNCRIHEGVTIGCTNGNSMAARIGDNVFISSGAKIIGDVYIANDVAIAANAVVVSDINEPGTTWGGIPAKKISNNDSHNNIYSDALEHIRKKKSSNS